MDKNKKIGFSILLLALFVGLADSIYLYYSYLTANPVSCFLFDGCGAVAASPYSKPFGIPLSLLGILFYLGMIISLVIYLRFKKIIFLNLVFAGSIMGFLMSLYFTFLQGFVIQAFCIYCLISAFCATIATCAAIYLRGSLYEESTPQINNG